MTENTKIIKFSIVCSLIFLIITYIITLNIEINFFSPNWAWISNNFALTISGGAFASFFVVMLCEIPKYLMNKHQSENQMFAYMSNIYSLLYFMNVNCLNLISNSNCGVPDNLFDAMDNIRNEVNAFLMIDYYTLSQKNNITTVHRAICAWSQKELMDFISNKNYLPMAIATDKINILESTGKTTSITSAYPYTHGVLTVLEKKFPPLLKHLDEQLQALDKNCKYRYNWSMRKNTIMQSIEKSDCNLDEFFKKHNYQLNISFLKNKYQ